MITPFPSGRKRTPSPVWNSWPSARLMGCPAPVGNSTVGEGCFTPLDATHFPSGDMSRAIPEPNRIAGEPSVLHRKTVYSAPTPSPSSSLTARCPSLETLRPSVQSNQERILRDTCDCRVRWSRGSSEHRRENFPDPQYHAAGTGGSSQPSVTHLWAVDLFSNVASRLGVDR